MATLIGFDFCFEEFSKSYGMFIVDALDAYPDGKVVKVSNHYPIGNNCIYVHFSAPEDVAVLLKLKYGAHIVERPKPEPTTDIESILKSLKNKKQKNDWFDTLNYNDSKIYNLYKINSRREKYKDLSLYKNLIDGEYN